MDEHSLSSPQAPPAKRIRLDGDDTLADEDEGPGDAARSETFFDCNNMGDKKTAGYLGFSNTSELHVCAISWPLLRATAAIYPIMHKLNKELALGLIRDAPRSATSAIVLKNWSLLDSDGKGLSNIRKAEHLAIVLINLKSDLARMVAASDDTNQLQHAHDCQKFRTVYPSHLCPPQISYPVKSPLLAPSDGEDFLESYNRCFSLLRHMRNILKSSVYDTRYNTDKFKSGHHVDEKYKPAWMRAQGSDKPRTTQPQHGLDSPPQSRRPSAVDETHKPWMPTRELSKSPTSHYAFGSASQPSPAAVKEREPPVNYQFGLSAIQSIEFHPSYEPPPISRSFAILWDHTIEPDYPKPGLKRAMNRAKAAGAHLPSEFQKLKKDPRDMDRETLFYEQIRAQFECRALGIDLGKLLLQYNSSTFGESILVTQNLEDEAWSDTQAALADSDNDKFVFRVGFFALDNDDDDN
ncbi:hypothetical protein D6D01_01806 [Aureobasidium pullulans]|uniref:Uncharacterized protein n=1 Tax=Aureobasidium pullulans TaxID=5580 RepID=A0A4S9LZI0_AURPU|nr:hypothetical protein D6D01_01806 [Aureobasidium pullulans]